MMRNSIVGEWRITLLCVAFVVCAVFAVFMPTYKETNGASSVSFEVEATLPVEETTSCCEAEEPSVMPLDGEHKDAFQLVVSKQFQTITLYDTKGSVICCYPVSVGRNFGNKRVVGDLKTPEGVFSIEMIQDASWWGHDSGDGNGFIPSCYGNWFMRLKTPPHRGIGIHASIRRPSIGKRASEGCICLHSENLDKLRPLVRESMRVVVETSLKDMEADGRCALLYDNTMLVNWFGKENVLGMKPVVMVVQDDVMHTVESGDTLLSLAIRYGTTRKNIEMLNPDFDLRTLTVGEQLLVKGDFFVPLEYVSPGIYNSRAMVASTDTLYYEASAIDNFGRIAVMHSTTRARIIELNPGVNPDKLVNGQIVRVR